MIVIITEEQKNKLSDSMLGERVMVYYNLHKKTFSVKKSGVVFLHADYVKLENVEFRVRPTGKERVRKEKSKNVHAFVIGDLKDFCKYPCDDIPNEPNGNIVTYNPYVNDSFVHKKNEVPVFTAKEVEMINRRDKVFIIKENAVSKKN